jgi:hypothetical protein
MLFLRADEFHKKLLALGLTEEDIAQTPAAVMAVLKFQMLRIEQLEKRVAELENQLGKNSSNSSKPPSSDRPYDKQHRRKKRHQAKKASRKGHRQQMLEPTETTAILPGPCFCGGCDHEQLVRWAQNAGQFGYPLRSIQNGGLVRSEVTWSLYGDQEPTALPALGREGGIRYERDAY